MTEIGSKSGKKTIWTKDYIILFFGTMAAMCGQYLVNSLLPLYSKELGASDKLVGTVVSLFYTVALCVRPFSGPAIDAWNRKRLYIIMMMGSALCMFGYASCTDIKGVMLFRCLHGVTYGTSVALSMTMATQDADAGLIATAITTFSLSSTLPQMVGPGLGLAMSEKFGYPATYILSGALMAAGALMGFFLDDRKEAKKPYIFKLDSIVSFPAIIPMILLTLQGLGSSCITTFYALLVKSRGLAGLSIYYTVGAISNIILKPIAGKMADRLGSTKVMYFGFAVLACNFVFMSKCHNELMVIISAVFNALGNSCTHPMIQGLAIKLTPKDKRGAASSTCYIGTDLGSLLGGFIWGAVAEVTDYATPFLLVMIPQTIALVITIFWYRAEKEKIDA